LERKCTSEKRPTASGNPPTVTLEAPVDADFPLNGNKKAVSCCKPFNDFDGKKKT